MPNAIIDLMPHMKEAELRVVLAIARQTLGWQRPCDVISISQFKTLTGLTRQGVVNGITAGLTRGLIARRPAKLKGQATFSYWLIIDDLPEVVNVVDHPEELGSQRSRPQVVNVVDREVVNVVDTQKKDVKETLKESAAADRNGSGGAALLKELKLGLTRQQTATILAACPDFNREDLARCQHQLSTGMKPGLLIRRLENGGARDLPSPPADTAATKQSTIDRLTARRAVFAATGEYPHA